MQSGRPRTKKEIIDNAISYLKANYSRPLNLDEVAKKVFLSPSYFSAIFKKPYRDSITDYVQRLRISKACYLLTQMDATVDEAMGAVGYSDSKFFSIRFFKRHTGVTPGTYKKRHKKQE